MDFHYFRARQPGFPRDDVYGPFDTVAKCEYARNTLIKKRFEVGMTYQAGAAHGRLYDAEDNMWLLGEEADNG